ncbi:MAG TPA: ATP-binding protein [Burkholderiales bacterium]|nr:ATP-binding protein [Burkholderiales bacterium]
MNSTSVPTAPAAGADALAWREWLRTAQPADALDRPSEPSFERHVRLARRCLHATAAFVMLAGDHPMCFSSGLDLNGTRFDPGAMSLFCAHVLSSREPVRIDDARLDVRLSGAAVVRDFDLVAYAGVPLLWQHEPVGTLCVVDKVVRRWTDDEVAVLADLAAGVATEIELRQRAELRLGRIVGAAHVGVTRLTSNGELLDANEAFVKLTGYSLQELRASGWKGITPPEYAERDREKLIQLARTGVSTAYEKEYVRKDGSRVAVLINSVRPVPSADEHICFVVDVTERKRASEALRAHVAELAQAHRQLEESYALLDTLFDKAPIGMSFVDRNTRFVRINAHLAAINQRSVADHIGRTVAEIAPQVWSTTAPLYQRALSGEAVVGVEVAARVGSSSDEQRHWLVNYYPVYVGDTIIGVGVVVLEITERKRAETALHDYAEQLKDADRRKDEFLAMLAHELRNPLAPIRNATELLRRLEVGEARSRQALDVLARQTSHLARLVDDLLDVSRVTQGKITLDRSPVQLADVLQAGVEMMRPQIDAKHQDLTVVLPHEPLTVDGDAVRLIQVVGNLLSNAAKFTEEGGKIVLTLARLDGRARIRVQDDGMGIPADLLPHVFDLFTQADRGLDRAEGGLGIGLSLVKSLVELHGGRVAVRSAGPGLGSTFDVELPLCTPAQTAKAETPSVESAARRVLVVDDNVDSAQSLATLLELQGHAVRYAYDGHAALEAAAQFRPQIVLLDIGLPGMDGFEVARRLRANVETAGAALVALTGYGQAEDRVRSKAAGFDHHLTKPVDLGELTSLIGSSQRAGQGG